MAEEIQNPDYVGLSGAGRAHGTDPLIPEDSIVQSPTARQTPISEGLQKYLSDNNMSAPGMAPIPRDTNPIDPISSQGIIDFMNIPQTQGLGLTNDEFQGGKQTKLDLRNPNNPNQFMERYSSHSAYKHLGFTPFRDNEELYGEKGSAAQDFGRAVSAWSSLAGLGAKDAAGFGDMVDTKVAEEYERAMALGNTSRGGLSGFATNLFLNSGYTMGIMAEIAAEEVAMVGAEFGLGAAGFFTGGTAWAAMPIVGGRMVQKGISGFTKIKKALNAGKTLSKRLDDLKDINKFRKAFAGGAKNIGNFLNPAENTIDFFRNIDKLKDADGLYDIGRVAFKGTGAAYRDVRMAKLAWGESALEGGMTSNQMERDLYASFRTANGREPDEQESFEIRQTAAAAGKTTSLINLPLIYFSNKMTFDGLLTGSMRRLQTNLVKHGTGRKMLITARKGAPEAVKILPENYFLARWEYIKDPKLWASGLMKYGKANIAEGLQETGQEIAGAFSSDYHTAKYEGDPARGGWMEHLANSTIKHHPLTGSGFEVFMSGFLMGGMISPVSNTMAAITQGKSGFQGTLAGTVAEGVEGIYKKATLEEDEYIKYKTTKADIKAQRENELNDTVNKLNEIFANPKDYFNHNMENMMEQKEYQKLMGLAEGNNDKKTYYDMQDASTISHIQTAIQYGQLGKVIEMLKDQQQLSDEEIAEISTLKPDEFRSKIDQTVEHAKNIESVHNMIQEKYPAPVDPWKYEPGSRKFIAAQLQLNAWNKATAEVIFNQATFNRLLARQTGILQKISEVSGLENAPYQDLANLMVTKDAEGALEALSTEIKGLDEAGTLTPEARKRHKEIKKKHETLDGVVKALRLALDNKGKNESVSEEDYKTLRTAFVKYMKFVAKTNGQYTNNDKMNDALQDIIDYHMLDARANSLNNAVNTMLDPQSFLNRADEIEALETMAWDNKKAEIRKSLKLYKKQKKGNKLLNALYEAGMFMDPKDFEKLDKEGKVPKYFHYQKDGEWTEVPLTHEDYKKAVGIINQYIDEINADSLSDIEIPEFRPDAYIHHARRKNDGDQRTYADLAKQFGFKEDTDKSEVPLKLVLQSIIESDYATEHEIALAEKLLEKADDREMVTFINNQSTPGQFSASAGTNTVDARYSAHDYRAGRFGHPMEHLILQGEVQRRLAEGLENDAEFSGEIDVLFKEAKAAWEVLSEEQKLHFYSKGSALKGLESPEEFVAAAMTNENFQQFLGTIKTKAPKDKRNLWVKFVDGVLKQIGKVLGVNTNGTVLNAALEVITAKIETKPGAPVEKGGVKKAGKVVTRKDSIASLRENPLHKSLLDTVVNMFKAENERLISEDDNPLLDGFEAMSTTDILASKEFAKFFKDPRPSKDQAILEHNKKLERSTKPTSTKKEIEKKRKDKALVKEKDALEREKADILKEIEELESESLNSEDKVEALLAIELQIKNLRQEDGSIADKDNEKWKQLQKARAFVLMSTKSQVNSIINDFVKENNLTESNRRTFIALLKLKGTLKGALDMFNKRLDTSFTLPSNYKFIEDVDIIEKLNASQEQTNKQINDASIAAGKEVGIEVDKTYLPEELDNLIKTHGNATTKIIWNLIRSIAIKLKIPTKFASEGNHSIGAASGGHFVPGSGAIENRARVLSNPEQAASIAVHELVHGVTSYIIRAVKNNQTEITSLLSKKQINAAKKLSNLLKEIQSDKAIKDMYGAKNEDELLAELVNPLFVEALKNKKLNFVEKILGYITDILGISTNAHAEAMSILEDFLVDPVNYPDVLNLDSSELYDNPNRIINTALASETPNRLEELKARLNVINARLEIINNLQSPSSKTEGGIKTFKSKNRAYTAALKALGYTSKDVKEIPIAEGNRIIEEGFTKEERQTKSEIPEVDPEEQALAQRLVNYMESEIAAITNGYEWEETKARLTAEFAADPKYRKLAGISSAELLAKLNEKLEELRKTISLDAIETGHVMILTDKKSTHVLVTAVGEGYIEIEHLTEGSKVETIQEKDLQNRILVMYRKGLEGISEKDLPEITPEEVELADESVANRITSEGAGADIAAAEGMSKEDSANNLLDNICK